MTNFNYYVTELYKTVEAAGAPFFEIFFSFLYNKIIPLHNNKGLIVLYVRIIYNDFFPLQMTIIIKKETQKVKKDNFFSLKIKKKRNGCTNQQVISGYHHYHYYY